jgi:hypothetical protein
MLFYNEEIDLYAGRHKQINQLFRRGTGKPQNIGQYNKEHSNILNTEYYC